MLSNLFATLPSHFYTFLDSTPIANPYWVHANRSLAGELNLEINSSLIQALSGNQRFEGSLPLAAVYSGHQFGQWAGQLGDGRAILLGDIAVSQTLSPNQHMEIQLKGSGLTPYSRRGDGRAVLRSSIREYLCSEAMAALNIPSSRALALIGSDETIWREKPESIAIVTRAAPTFIRFGSFEHWYYRQDYAALKTLADFVIAQYYPDLAQADNPYAALLQEITRRTAHLMAHWQAIGFMHGVMNTDNMSILGLTLDYGPFGFMESYQPHHICNHSDHTGRYAYDQQPHIGQWNCFALGQALLPLIGEVETTQNALAHYQADFLAKTSTLLHDKLGLTTQQDHDQTLFNDLFALLKGVDFTTFFRRLSHISLSHLAQDAPIHDLFIDRAALDVWIHQYRARLQLENSQDVPRQQKMLATNPKYILRNYLAQIAIDQAEQHDFSEVDTLFKVLSNPFAEQPEYEKYANLPPDWASGIEISCSS